MRTDWPGGAEVAVSLTFDVDAESGWLGSDPAYAGRLSTLSEGRFGVTRGLPRILEILDRHEIKATFYVPGDTAERHTEAIRTSSNGATRSATTVICTSRATRSHRSSRRRRSTGASARSRTHWTSRRRATAARAGS